MFTEPVANV